MGEFFPVSGGDACFYQYGDAFQNGGLLALCQLYEKSRIQGTAPVWRTFITYE